MRDHYPFSYESEGEFTGIARESLDKLVEQTGFVPEYLSYDSIELAQRALRRGEIDIIAYNNESYASLLSRGIVQISRYATSTVAVVTNRKESVTRYRSIAVTRELRPYVSEAVDDQEVKIQQFNKETDCLKAVHNGEVDVALADNFLANYLISSSYDYEKGKITTILPSNVDIYIVGRSDIDSRLSDIIKKMINSYSQSQINRYVAESSPHTLFQLERFFRNHAAKIVLALLVIILIVILTAAKIINDNIQIQELLHTDPVLGIWNPSYFRLKGEQILKKSEEEFAVVTISVIGYHVYEGFHGEKAGVALLKQISAKLSALIRLSDKEMYCIGQTERFLCLLQIDGGDREAFDQRIKNMLEEIQEDLPSLVKYTVSFRAAVCLVNESLESAITNAGIAENHIQEKEHIAYYDQNLLETLEKTREFDEMLDQLHLKDYIVPFYQGKVDINTGSLIGAEALARMIDPRDPSKYISPGLFIPHYEQTGRIDELDFLILEKTCQFIAGRIHEGKKVLPISCNFSRNHFATDDFTERLLYIIDRYDIPRELIEVEITESMIMNEAQLSKLKNCMQELDELGITIAIDDFGAGFSSLGVFEQIPASVLKLDRSFLLNKTDKERQINIMRSILLLAKSIHAEVICEGVETEEQVELMREIGAIYAQGFKFYRPQPEDIFESYL